MPELEDPEEEGAGKKTEEADKPEATKVES